MNTLTLGFSPCPNDTFMFHGLVSGAIAVEGLRFEPILEDIEALNRRAVGANGTRRLVTKISAAILPEVQDEYTLLRSGAALGRGCGPLVVVAPGSSRHGLDELSGARVGIPGSKTTAARLLRRFAPADIETVEMRFDRIMSAVLEGDLDAGVVIHEGRFVFEALGLVEIADLGTLWERHTGLPLPLGVIVGQRSLGGEILGRIEAGIAESIRYAREHPEACWLYVRAHAQEMDEDVCRRHIALYVNEFSIDLGPEGEKALDQLHGCGHD